jgi:hypothetical protein
MSAFTFATLALSLLPLFADATPLHPGTTDVASQMESSSLNSRASFVAPSNGTQLYFNGNTRQCLTVNNGYAAQGTVVALVGCFAPTDPAINLQLWTVKRDAPGHVQLTLHPDLCLDFGTNPASGGDAKVWTCYDGLPQQTFWYTDDNRIAVYNGGECMMFEPHRNVS